MARIYHLGFSEVTVSAAQDLVLVTGATGKLIKILRVWLACTNTTLATQQMLSLRGRYLPATVTVGSGGSVNQTPSKMDQGDATCSTATCGLNNTVKATTSGTAVIQWRGACHLYQGEDKRFDSPPTVPPSTAWVFELISTAVSGSVALSGGVYISEES